MVYADKAADDRSALHPLAAPGAPVLGRGEHLRRDDVPQPADHAAHALPVHGPAAGRRGALLVRPQGRADGGLGLALLPDGPARRDRTLPSWVQAVVLLLSFRPILGDLHHGNNNLLILFLIVASL